MKKLLLILLIFPYLCVNANELTEDYIDIATNYCTYGKYDDALQYINKVLQIEPTNADYKELKNTLLRVTNPNIESYLTTNSSILNQAVKYKKEGNRSGQLEVLEKNPNDFWTNYFLAEYHLDNDNFQNAIFYYKKAINLKPNYSQSYLGLAKAQIENREFQNAIDNLDKYLTYNKNSDIAYALRANAKMNLNYIIEAEEDIKKAHEIEENIYYLLLDAEILYYKGYYDEAKYKLNILSRNIQTSEVYKFLGLCDYALKDYNSAMLNLNKAIILSDEDKSLISAYDMVKSILDNK